MIEYKGYSGLMEINVEDGVISGRVLGIRDVVTFEGDRVAEAEKAFRDSVDDYLEFCAERGVPPDRPFSGKFILRIRPELHRALAVAAEARRMSLNAFVEEVLAAGVSVEGETGSAREPLAEQASGGKASRTPAGLAVEKRKTGRPTAKGINKKSRTP